MTSQALAHLPTDRGFGQPHVFFQLCPPGGTNTGGHRAGQGRHDPAGVDGPETHQLRCQILQAVWRPVGKNQMQSQGPPLHSPGSEPAATA